MGTGTYTVTESTNTAVARKLVVGTRAKASSTIPAVATDFVGDVFPDLTFDFAAGATSATAVLNVKPNAAVDGNREVEFYTKSMTPTGGTVTFNRTFSTITDDDAPTSTNFYGPKDATGTGPVNVGSSGWKLSAIVSDTAWKIELLSDDNTFRPAYSYVPVNSTHITAYRVAADGSQSNDNVQNYMYNPETGALSGPGVLLELTCTADGLLTLKVDGVVVKGQYQSGDTYRPSGTLTPATRFMRFTGNNTIARSITVASL
jgi:hypothetical protein